jgi:hypothetical protein
MCSQTLMIVRPKVLDHPFLNRSSSGELTMHLFNAGLARPLVRNRRSLARLSLIAAVGASNFALVACDELATAPRGTVAAKPAFAVVSNPRATFTYFNQASVTRADGKYSGFITGDNRNADGSALGASSVYDDGRCGVKAQVFIGASGDATLDPNGIRFAGCIGSATRVVTLDFGQSIVGTAYPTATAAHFSNIRQVEQLPYTGDPQNVNTASRRFRLQLAGDGMKNCGWIRYGTTDANGNHVPLTVIINGIEVISAPLTVQGTAPNTWLATSQPNAAGKHVALCEKSVKGGVAYTGAYDIPVQLQAVQR